jgi:hypothetical protein
MSVTKKPYLVSVRAPKSPSHKKLLLPSSLKC